MRICCLVSSCRCCVLLRFIHCSNQALRDRTSARGLYTPHTTPEQSQYTGILPARQSGREDHFPRRRPEVPPALPASCTTEKQTVRLIIAPVIIGCCFADTPNGKLAGEDVRSEERSEILACGSSEIPLRRAKLALTSQRNCCLRQQGATTSLRPPRVIEFRSPAGCHSFSLPPFRR